MERRVVMVYTNCSAAFPPSLPGQVSRTFRSATFPPTRHPESPTLSLRFRAVGCRHLPMPNRPWSAARRGASARRWQLTTAESRSALPSGSKAPGRVRDRHWPLPSWQFPARMRHNSGLTRLHRGRNKASHDQVISAEPLLPNVWP